MSVSHQSLTPSEDSIPAAPLEKFQLFTFSMNAWESLGNTQLADANQRGAEALLKNSEQPLQRQMLYSLQFSTTISQEAEALRALQLVSKAFSVGNQVAEYFLNQHPSTTVNFRAARLILNNDSHETVTTRDTDKSANSIKAKASELFVELGANFEQVVSSMIQLKSEAKMGSFDNNPLIGQLTDQIKYLARPKTQKLVISYLEESLVDKNAGVRLAASIILRDLLDTPLLSIETMNRLSEIAPYEENDHVRYYMTEALSIALHRKEAAEFPETRTNIARALLDLRHDQDPGIKNIAVRTLA